VSYNDGALATVPRVVYPHITKDPGVRAGRACIDGTRIAVIDIVSILKEGRRPEEMVNVFASPLSLAQVYAALAYYYDNTNEIDAAVAEARSGRRSTSEVGPSFFVVAPASGRPLPTSDR